MFSEPSRFEVTIRAYIEKGVSVSVRVNPNLSYINRIESNQISSGRPNVMNILFGDSAYRGDNH